MKFINVTPNPSGAYPGPHKAPFPGCLPLTDSQAETLVAYNGFVTITREPDPEIEGSGVTVVTEKGEYTADVAILGAGFRPNTALFADQLRMLKNGAIVIDDYSDLRPARQARNITLTAAADHFSVWPNTISRLERGLKRDDTLAATYRQWLNTQLNHAA